MYVMFQFSVLWFQIIDKTELSVTPVNTSGGGGGGHLDI